MLWFCKVGKCLQPKAQDDCRFWLEHQAKSLQSCLDITHQVKCYTGLAANVLPCMVMTSGRQFRCNEKCNPGKLGQCSKNRPQIRPASQQVKISMDDQGTFCTCCLPAFLHIAHVQSGPAPHGCTPDDLSAPPVQSAVSIQGQHNQHTTGAQCVLRILDHRAHERSIPLLSGKDDTLLHRWLTQ